jgi:DNA-binding MarR family transcriptional regulator
MTQTAVAADLDLTKVAIGGLIDRMEAAGFVERRPDANDGRIRRIYLTKAGAKMVSKIRASVDKIETEILAGVTEEQLNQAAGTLRILKRTLLEIAGGELEETEGSFITVE